MATSNSSYTENASVPSALEAALEILRSSDFSVDDLPKKLNSPLWSRLEKELGLALGQLSSLQNYVESKISATPADELVNVDEKKRVPRKRKSSPIATASTSINAAVTNTATLQNNGFELLQTSEKSDL